MGFERLLRHGTLIAVAVLVLCVLGTAAALRVPVQMIPDLEVRTIGVQTRWPGATPQDVEQEILLEQEKYLRTIPNLSRMVSSASTGQGTARAMRNAIVIRRRPKPSDIGPQRSWVTAKPAK